MHMPCLFCIRHITVYLRVKTFVEEFYDDDDDNDNDQLLIHECTLLCTIVVYNTAQISSDNIRCCRPDNLTLVEMMDICRNKVKQSARKFHKKLKNTHCCLKPR